MTQTADLIDRLNRLAYRRDQEGIYTDATIASEAATALAERERERDHWHDCFVALNKAVVGSPGLSAITVAPKLRARAEKAEAMLARVADVLGPFAKTPYATVDADPNLEICVGVNIGHLRAARALYEETRALAKAEAPEGETK